MTPATFEIRPTLGQPRVDKQDMKGTPVEPFGGCNELTRRIIATAFEMHDHLGPGPSESTYENALRIELRARSLAFVHQPLFDIEYKGVVVGTCRPDLVVEGLVIVELKAVDSLTPMDKAQVVKYLRVSGLRIGLLINFNVESLRHGIRRVVTRTKRKSSVPSVKNPS